MRRHVPTLAISPTMLKRFAAATLAITLLLALFANGESSELAAKVAERQQLNERIKADPNAGNTTLAKPPAAIASKGGWGNDDVDSPGGSGGAVAPEALAPKGPPPGVQRLGPTGAQPLMAHPDPRAVPPGHDPMRMIGIAPGAKGGARKPRPPVAGGQVQLSPEQAAALRAASQRRSGSPETGD